jgi:hypothetical protein
VTLLLDGWWRSRDLPDLAERLRPFGRRSVADDARRWLDQAGVNRHRWANAGNTAIRSKSARYRQRAPIELPATARRSEPAICSVSTGLERGTGRAQMSLSAPP